ncbi:MAG: HEAT repeat domain-containing protein [Planctomycetota bacterium]|nr:HEAT repeat domain-containing protein [Planctomycetota bacterium]
MACRVRHLARDSRFTRPLLALWFALSLVRPAAAGEFPIGAHTFTVPDGFEVELAAGPPLVDRPITADFDEEGRLYVSDSAGVNDKVQKQLETRPHRILRLEDTDGDGRFDRRTVFADRMMFPEGTMWFDGSLYVAAPPSIWKLTDTDGDGVADRREEWFQGKTLTGCANDLHGPYLGRDGWIYWCKGAFAEQTHERPGRPPFVTRAAHIFRRRPGTPWVEPVMTGGMDNPVDVVFTREGERIFTTTFLQHPGGGKRDGLIHAIYGGVYGKVQQAIEGHKRTGEDVMPGLTHLGPAAPCGLALYESPVFGPGFRGNLFAALFNLHKVTRHVLEPSGATFQSRDSDFLVSHNPDFHPTDVLEDADGSLLVVDTGGWYKLCCPTSQLFKPDVLGGIYRVRRQGVASPADPRGARLGWKDLEPGGLVKLLGDERPAVRRRAVDELARKGPRALPALARVLRTSRRVEQRLGAVWTLARLENEKARGVVRAALRDADDSVRQAASHVAGLWRDSAALPALLEILGSGPPPLQRSAAEAIGRLEDRAAVPALLTASAGPADRVLEHSLTYALLEIADPESTARGLKEGNPRTQRAALVALDQMDGSDLAAVALRPFLSSRDARLRQTAFWVLGRHAEWAGELAAFLEARLRASAPSSAELGELEALLARVAGTEAVQELLAGTLEDESTGVGTRSTALRAMRRSGLKEAPARWASTVADVVGGDDLRLVEEAVATARRLKVPESGAAEMSAALLGLAGDEKRPEALRLEALAALPGRPRLDGRLFRFLIERLDSSRPVRVRLGAAGVLGRSRLGPEQLLALSEGLKNADALVLNRLIAALEKISDEALGLAFVKALEEAPGAAGLHPAPLRAWLEKAPPAVRRRGERLMATLDEDTATQRKHLDELAASLPKGDVRRGQKVFNDPKAACAACHAIGYLGGKLGPDLTRIGKVRTERDLLESLVYPNISFVRSYEPVVVISRRGDVWSGILSRDAPDEIVLSTGADTQLRVARSDIAEMQPGKVSVMPGGLTELLSPQQLADLVAFLKATQW